MVKSVNNLVEEHDINQAMQRVLANTRDQTGIVLCLSLFASYVAAHFMPTPAPAKLHPLLMHSIMLLPGCMISHASGLCAVAVVLPLDTRSGH